MRDGPDDAVASTITVVRAWVEVPAGWSWGRIWMLWQALVDTGYRVHEVRQDGPVMFELNAGEPGRQS